MDVDSWSTISLDVILLVLVVFVVPSEVVELDRDVAASVLVPVSIEYSANIAMV